MNILVLGNGSLSVAAQEYKICFKIAELGHKVYLIQNEKLRLFDVGEINKSENLIAIDIPFQEYRFESLLDHSDILDLKSIDICLGMDQSVCPFVAEFKNRMHIKSFCMFLDFPVHVIDGKDPFSYNFGYSQRYYYWLTCALELDGVIFNNSVAVEEFYKRYKRDSFLVFYAITNDNCYEMFKDSKPTKDYVFGCHRLIKYKGTDLILQALRKLPYSYQHVFVSGDPKEIENIKILSKELKNHLVFYNKADELKKMELYYNAKLVVYPQITEWIGGLSIIEGMSVKTPGICFDYPVLRELYDDAVLYIKPRSVLGLRNAIKTLYEDDSLNNELAEKGFERFNRLFTTKVMAENILKVFSEG